MSDVATILLFFILIFLKIYRLALTDRIDNILRARLQARAELMPGLKFREQNYANINGYGNI